MLGHTAMHGGSVAFSLWRSPDSVDMSALEVPDDAR
jgi:hypothetical protein